MGMPSKRAEYLGNENYNNQGCLMKVAEYNSYNDIIIEFQDEHKHRVHTKYSCFLNGSVYNPYLPHKETRVSKGYIGNTSCKTPNGDFKKSYIHWNAMITRCSQSNNETYKDCSICDEWLCFENFEKWFDVNYYEIPNERMFLDKDIIKKGNKIYCPEYCCFVNRKINNMFTKNNKNRGDLPIGVTEDPLGKYKYRVVASKKYLGRYNDLDEAFCVYKEYKENLIKEQADRFKEYLPQNVYDALYNYQVEIKD